MRTGLVLFLMFVSTGCLVGRRNITLPSATPARAASACVEVHPLVDARQDRTLVGNVRNGFGTVIGEIHTDDDVVGWVGTQLTARLAKLDCGGGNYVLDGKVHEVFVDDVVRARARIAVTLTLQREGVVVVQQTFVGTAKKASWGTTDEYRWLLGAAAEKLAGDVASRFGTALHARNAETPVVMSSTAASKSPVSVAGAAFDE